MTELEKLEYDPSIRQLRNLHMLNTTIRALTATMGILPLIRHGLHSNTVSEWIT